KGKIISGNFIKPGYISTVKVAIEALFAEILSAVNARAIDKDDLTPFITETDRSDSSVDDYPALNSQDTGLDIDAMMAVVSPDTPRCASYSVSSRVSAARTSSTFQGHRNVKKRTKRAIPALDDELFNTVCDLNCKEYRNNMYYAERMV